MKKNQYSHIFNNQYKPDLSLLNIKMSERQLTHSIIEYLNYQGFYVWRENTGAMTMNNKDGSTRFVRFGEKGMSDIVGLRHKDGKFIAIEVKLPTTAKRVTPAQESFLEMVKEHNGIALVVTSIDDLKQKLEDLKI